MIRGGAVAVVWVLTVAGIATREVWARGAVALVVVGLLLYAAPSRLLVAVVAITAILVGLVVREARSPGQGRHRGDA